MKLCASVSLTLKDIDSYLAKGSLMNFPIDADVGPFHEAVVQAKKELVGFACHCIGPPGGASRDMFRFDNFSRFLVCEYFSFQSRAESSSSHKGCSTHKLPPREDPLPRVLISIKISARRESD